MQCGRYSKRLTAWLLTFLMMLSLVMVPAGKVQAADVEVANATDSSKPVYVEFPLESTAATYNQYKVTIHNNSGGTISDWTITVKFNSNPGWNAGWNGATYDPNTMTMTINTYAGSDWDNATIYDNEYDTGAGFQIAAGALNDATVTLTYDNGVSNDGPSSGGGSGSGAGSSSITDTSTNKDLNVEFNYAKVLQESLYFYDANMCGRLEGTCALDWRGNCHTYDSNVTYTKNGVTYNVDASGGFHDAGDHIKFGLPQGYAATMLGMSYYQFKDAYTELEQAAHLQKITDYFCDYFRRCTVYDKNDKSKVVAFCYQVGDGGTDHALWSAPEGQTLNRPAYFADSSNPATDQVCVAIAALAMNYINFGNEADLQVAKDLFTFVQGNELRCATDGCSAFYPSSSWGDDYATAAAALYVATGRNNETYKTVYDTYKNDSKNGVNEYWVVDWDNTGAFAVMLMGQDISKLKGMVDTCKSATILDGVFSCLFEWGSCRYNAAAQFVGLVYDKNTSTTTYKSWATSQMNYIIGDNPNKRCYIVGYNENSSQYPHHRAASRSTDAAATNENHYTLLGALVGGPSSNGVYKDDQSDYECNEVALDYNAGLVGAAAGLYLAHKNADTIYLSYAKENTDHYSTELATAEELDSVGVTTYYGSSSAETVPVESITLDTTQLTLLVGGTQTLTATVSPDDATNKKVTWSSSDATVATVSNGKVTAIDAGTATITAKAGEQTATCTVTVQKPAELTASVSKLDCGTLAYGYTSVSATSANVKNEGGVATKPSSTTFENGTCFEIFSQPTNVTISPDGSSTIAVKPKTGLAVGTYSDTVIITYDGKTLRIPVLVTIDKQTNNNEVATPVLASRTANSIKVNEIQGVVYSLNKENWQPSGTFTGLTEFTEYQIYAMYAETATQYESAVCETPLQVYTLVSNPYTIDVSKVMDANYMDALRTANNGTESATTATYANGVLTLTESNHTYTITGNNENVTVKVPYGNTNIVLDNAVIKKLDVTNATSPAIKVSGVSAVQEIISTSNETVSITGNGILNAAQIKSNGNLLINGPTLDVDATTIGGAAISADSITISGGNVTTVGGNGAAAITGNTIQIENSSVTATGGSGASAIETTGENGSITMKDASVVVNIDADSEKSPISSDDITLVGNNAISSSTGTDNIYSSIPKDENGNILASYTVKFLDVDGQTELTTITSYAGGQITLPNIDKVTGYVVMWKNQTSGETYQPQSTFTVNDNVTFIVDKQKILVNKITLDITSVTLEVGEGEILTETVEPADALDKSVTWSSSNSAVATVTTDGEVDAVAPGIAVITAKAKDGSGVTGTCTVTVVQGEPETVYAEGIKITGATKKVAPGKKLKLTAAVYPENAVNKQVKWKVSNQKYATVNSKGVVTTKKAGKGKKVTVTAYLADDSSIIATYKISIMKNPVKKIKLSAKTTTLKKGRSVTIKAKFTPSKGISKELTWTSSNKKVATVNAKGKVTAKKKGTTKITAKAKDGSGKKATIKIRVK